MSTYSQPPPSEAAPQTVPLSGIQVLLVDDVPMNRDIIGAFLCAAGYSVRQAASGQEAVRLVSDQLYVLILMDVRMPEVDGLEATRRIRALPAPRGLVPILALTARTHPNEIAQCRNAGMDGHIAKPVEYETLIRAVAGTIAGTELGWDKDWVALPSATEKSEKYPLPRFDRAILDQTLAFLPTDEVVDHLQLLRARGEHLVKLIDQPTAPAALTDAAHALASAAVFGFIALSILLRSLERAVANEAPETPRLTQTVQHETRAAILELDALIGESWIQPA